MAKPHDKTLKYARYVFVHLKSQLPWQWLTQQLTVCVFCVLNLDKAMPEIFRKIGVYAWSDLYINK